MEEGKRRHLNDMKITLTQCHHVTDRQTDRQTVEWTDGRTALAAACKTDIEPAVKRVD